MLSLIQYSEKFFTGESMRVNFEAIRQGISKERLPVIGIGSGRIVYDLANGYVVKMARNKKGLAQNKAEFRIAAAGSSPLIANILSVSMDYKYLIMEKAEKIRSVEPVCLFHNVSNLKELFRKDYFSEFIRNNELLLPDLYRKSSWGIINGRPVLVDYGFTKDVRRYYRII